MYPHLFYKSLKSLGFTSTHYTIISLSHHESLPFALREGGQTLWFPLRGTKAGCTDDDDDDDDDEDDLPVQGFHRA